MNTKRFDEGTEQLYRIAHNTSSLPLIRVGGLAAIFVYYTTAFLEAYLFLSIDRENSPWLLITTVTTVSIAMLYGLTYIRYFLLRLDIIVLLAAVVISCQHSFYFSYYELYPAFSFAFSQAIAFNLLVIITPDFRTLVRCSVIMLALPLILDFLFDLERIMLFEAYYFLGMCVAVTVLISRFLDYKNRQAFLLREALHQEKKLMEELANKDALTGCFNRRYFGQLGEMEFQRALRFRHALSLITLDIDHFK